MAGKMDASLRAGVEFFTAQFTRIANGQVPGVRFDANYDAMHDAYRLRALARIPSPAGSGEKDKQFVIEQMVRRDKMESFSNYSDAATEVLKTMTAQLDGEMVKHTLPPPEIGALLHIAGMVARYVVAAEAFDIYWKDQPMNTPGPGSGCVARIDINRPIQEWQHLLGKLHDVRVLRETHAELVIDVSPQFLRQFHDPRDEMKKVEFPDFNDDIQRKIADKYAAYEDMRRRNVSPQMAQQYERQLRELILREREMRMSPPIMYKPGPIREPWEI